MGCLDTQLIVNGIKMSWVYPELEEKMGVTTVVICGYGCIGVCRCIWVVVLVVLLGGTICLCRVNKMVILLDLV